MIIKCHLCKEEVEESTVRGICEHLTDYHKWENILINEYAKLIFKIHEKIESLQNRIDALKKDNRFDTYIINQLERLEAKQEELKSLLKP